MSDVPGTSAGHKRAIPWKLVLWVAIALYALLFFLLNDDKQSVDFVFFTVKTRLPWLILLSMALGAALAVMGPRWGRSRELERRGAKMCAPWARLRPSRPDSASAAQARRLGKGA